MPFVFATEDVEGSCFRFLENGDEKRTEIFLIKPMGKTVHGTLALQVFNDRNYRRITFADAENLLAAGAKNIYDYIRIATSNNIFGSLYKAKKVLSQNPLCHFDFSDQELAFGKKLMRMEYQESALSVCLMCYDFTSYTGCAYKFESMENAQAWGNAIGIDKVYLYDIKDKFDSLVDLSTL